MFLTPPNKSLKAPTKLKPCTNLIIPATNANVFKIPVTTRNNFDYSIENSFNYIIENSMAFHKIDKGIYNKLDYLKNGIDTN
jgi:hypothetical protein